MSEQNYQITNLAEELRRAFDEEFSRAPGETPPPQTQLLAVQIAGQSFALRTSEVHALLTREQFTMLPGATAGFLGLLGHDAEIVPVYSLGELLGFPRSPSYRWFVLAAAGDPIAFAFDGYEGSRSYEERAFVPVEDGAHHAAVKFLVEDEGRSRALISLESFIRDIESHCRRNRSDS